jgi:hypothetical protein
MALYVVAFTEPSGSRCLCCLRAVPVTSPADSRGSGGVQISGRSCTACPLALPDSDVFLTHFLPLSLAHFLLLATKTT